MQKPMPRSFEYISRRLIRELFGEIEQGKPEWKLDAFKFDAKIVPISLDAKRSARQENIYWMTEYVTREIDQITGSIVYPGTYVRCTMEFTWDVLSQTVRATGQPVDFGWFFGMTSVEEVAVVLLGSPENFLGYNPPETATHGWRTSSDPMIMQLIQEGLEEEPDKFTDSDLLANAVDLSRDSIEAGRGVALN